MSSSSDRRTKLSQRLMREALFELLEEKELESISITEICKKADLNRGTFYKYYRDVDDLFRHIENEFIENIRSQLDLIVPEEEQSVESSLNQILQILTDNEDYVRIAQNEEITQRIVQSLFTSIESKLVPVILRRYPDGDDWKTAYILEYFLGGCCNVIIKWIREGQQDAPQKIISLLLDLI